MVRNRDVYDRSLILNTMHGCLDQLDWTKQMSDRSTTVLVGYVTPVALIGIVPM